MEKPLKYEIRRCEVGAMEKIAEDLVDAARWHNTKILFWHINKLSGNGQSGSVPVNIRMRPQ